MENKYLAHVLKIEDLEGFGKKVCIVSGVGSGKNYWVENELSKHGKILLITSRKAIKDEIILNNNNSFETSSINDLYGESDYVVMTHSRLSLLIRNSKYPTDLLIRHGKQRFDYIIIDEAHCLVCDSSFTSSTFHLWTFIENALSAKTTIILMTATVEPIRYKLKMEEWRIEDYSDKCDCVKINKIEIIDKIKALKLLGETSANNKAIYMANSALGIAESLYQDLINNKIDSAKVSCIMSDKRRDELYIDKPLEILKNNKCYDSLTVSNKLPDEIEILLTTSRLKEGVNIKDESITKIFVESHYSIDIIQFVGRVRYGVDTIYLVDDVEQNSTYIHLLEYQYMPYELDCANTFLNGLAEKEMLIKEFIDFNVVKICNFYSIDKSIKWFIEFIEAKFRLIKFNHFSNQFQPYYQMQEAIISYNMDIESYAKDNIKFLKKSLKIDNIICSVKNVEQYADEYIEINNYLNKKIGSSERDIILKDLTELGARNSNKKVYKQLNSLLKGLNYSMDITGNHNNNEYVITKLIKKT
jgi:hypothetical protein